MGTVNRCHLNRQLVLGARARQLGLHSAQEALELAKGNSLWLWTLISSWRHLRKIRPDLGALLCVKDSSVGADDSLGCPS